MTAIAAQEVETVQAETAEIVRAANATIIETDADLEAASYTLKSVADSKKSIEDRRQFFVRPLNDQVKSINDLFKQLTAPLLEADTVIRGKVTAYRTAQAEIAAPPRAVGNVATRKVWKFHVEQAALVPREYLIVDDRLIREAVRTGVRDITGVAIFQEEEIAVR